MTFDTSRIEWCDSHELQSRTAALIKPAFSVLDIGCGIRPQQFITPELLICIEPHHEYVEILKKNLHNANAVIIPLDAIQALKGLPNRSVDCIFLIDVIEHMTKEVGVEVIRECERVARQQVVLFTPLGFMPQETLTGEVDGWNLHGGDWQDHKSGWYPEDFPGWDVVACKHLHAMDVKGEAIDPPYGAFYAIKSISKNANYFNDVYAREVLASNTSHLNTLGSLFPQFIDQVVTREVQNSDLKCGMKACQKTTELFIEVGSSKSTDEILALVNQQKTNDYLLEARNFNTKIAEFAAQFLDVDSREAELAARNEEVMQRENELTQKNVEAAQHESELTQRSAEAAQREVEFSARSAELAQREVELAARNAELAQGEIELAVRTAEVAHSDASLTQRESEFAEQLKQYDSRKLVQIYRTLKRVFK